VIKNLTLFGRHDSINTPLNMEYKWQSLLRMSFLNFLILKDQTEVKILIDAIEGGKALEVVLSGNKISPMLFPKSKKYQFSKTNHWFKVW
jgi:hypothetical protein